MITHSGPILLDTNIVLHLVRGNDYAARIARELGLQNRPLPPLISVVSVGELLGFARHRNWGANKIAELRQVMNRYVILDIIRPVTERYAEIHAFLVQQGKSASDNDIWIAATASVHNAQLVTMDKDFEPLSGTYIQLSCFEVTST